MSDFGFRPFFSSDEATDSIYVSHRDHGTKAQIKAMIEDMWLRYAPVCPDNHKDFLTDARSHFVQRVWEMYLANVIMGQFKLQKPPPEGPDILFEHEGVRYWVEAVSPGPGEGPNAVPQRSPDNNLVPMIPAGKLLLRLTHAMREKELKFEKYRAKGIVNEDDACVIAVNISGIRDADLFDQDGPMAVRALFPVGEVVLRFKAGSSDQPVIDRNLRRGVLKKKFGPDGPESDEFIPTDLFLDPRSASISCMFYSSWGIWFNPEPLGRDIYVIHNPQAKVPIAKDLLQFGREHIWLDGHNLHRERR